MDLSEFQKRYASGERHFNWIELQGVSLADAQLPEVILSRAKLAKSNWDRANFSRGSFRKTDLQQASLQQTQFNGAILVKANLSQCNLQQADLSGADLSGANLEGTNLTEANLTGTNLTSTNLTKANLTGANLTDAKLNRADLSEAMLDRAILDNANLTDINLTEATMPDGTAYEEWQLSNPAISSSPEPESDSEPEPEFSEDRPNRYLLPQRDRVELKQHSFFTSTLGLSGKTFWRSLPFKLLFAWVFGYFLLGIQLAIYQASGWVWAIAIFGSILWALDEVLIWVVPLVAAFTILMSMPINLMLILTLSLAAVITIVSAWSMNGLGWGLWNSIKNAVFIGGVVLLFLTFIAGLLTSTADNLSLSTFVLLVLTIVAIATGVLSCERMGHKRYSKTQTLAVLFGLAIAGMGLGQLLYVIS